MTLWRLIAHEMAFRKWGFAMGLLCVAAAVASLVGTRAMLQGHDLRTERIVAEKEAQTRQEMARLEDDYRRIMRRLGYNVLILHRDEDIPSFLSRGYPETTLPEDHALQLGRADIHTINHLLPVLQAPFEWPETGRTILLTGVRGQVPVLSQPQHLTPDGQYRSPIMEPVPEGRVDLGHDLAMALRVAPGGEVTIAGEAFTVNKVYPRRGTTDDNTVWMRLDRVQQWLDLPGRVSGILALECVCEPDSLGQIVQEITAILPDVQVREFSSLVRVRAQARQRAEQARLEAIAAEMEGRHTLRRERETLAATVVPVIVGVAAVWIAILSFGNARDRRMEIGVLRALGLRSGQILKVFLGKAFAMGLLGALAGYAIGLVGGVWLGGGASLSSFFDPLVLVLVLLAAPLLSILSVWLPATMAAQQDPAAILREN